MREGGRKLVRKGVLEVFEDFRVWGVRGGRGVKLWL